MNFIHKNALCETDRVGEGTKVWAFAHILPGAIIGNDCNICDGVFIEGDVIVGNNVTIKCGVQLWNGLRIEDNVFIGPNATFTNDLFPRSRKWMSEHPETRICKGASIGANATILPGLTIGENAMIGAGTVVTKSIPPYAIVVGNPCRIIGYEGSRDKVPTDVRTQSPAGQYAVVASTVQGVCLHHFPSFSDIRGDLSVGNFSSQVPFSPARYFLVYGVPSSETRGEHAHKTCEQFLICVSGSVSVVADDGCAREEFVLNKPNIGLYLPPMIWGIQYKYSADAVLIVFASHAYDNADYIRTYEKFVELTKK